MVTGTTLLAGPRISATGSTFDSTKNSKKLSTSTLSSVSIPRILAAERI